LRFCPTQADLRKIWAVFILFCIFMSEQNVQEQPIGADVEKVNPIVESVVEKNPADFNEINFKIVDKTIDFNGSNLSLQTGLLARLTDGAVLVTYGETKVLCAVVYDKKKGVKNDFFPLMVLYQEKQYAANRIPGGYLKREGKPSDGEV
jgi:hypothetical protein